MSVCPSCGAENPTGTERCATCGRPLMAARAAVPPPPPASAPPPLPPPPRMPPLPAPLPLPPGSAPPGRPTLTPMTPLPPAAPDSRRGARLYFYGLAGGAFPLLLALVSVAVSVSRNPNPTLNASAGFGLLASAILYVAALITMIVFLMIPRLRPVGYGLLTAVAASPVIFAVGCTALVFSGGL